MPVIRPATRADIKAYAKADDAPSMRAIVMERDGEIIAIGGIALTRGRWIGFCDLQPEARVYKMHIARAARRFLAKARADGIRFIYAGRDEAEPGSLAWLTSLGFIPDPKSQILYRWSAK
jgi:hypothetical protein